MGIQEFYRKVTGDDRFVGLALLPEPEIPENLIRQAEICGLQSAR